MILKIAARCLVTRGIAGSYESGEIATSRLEVLSYNMPVWIKIILPAFESDRVLAEIEKMVTNGIVTVQDLTRSSPIRNSWSPDARGRPEYADVLYHSDQKGQFGHAFGRSSPPVASPPLRGLPVVDSENLPVGIISQSDLIYKAGMPMRLGLLAESDAKEWMRS